MAYCYATSNLLGSLVAGSFTFSAGLNDTTRARLVDVRMDTRYINGNAASGLTLVIDMGSAVTLTGFALLNHTAAVQKTDAAVRVRGATNAAISLGVATAKAASTLNSTAPKNKDHVLQFAAVTKQYWELTFTWTGAVTNFSIGELWAFNAQTQLSRKAVYGEAEARRFKVVEVEFDNGNRRGYRLGGPLRELRLPFADLTSAQLEELYTLVAAVNGGASPFLWIPSYEATAVAAASAEQEVIYGTVVSPDFEFTIPDYLLYQPNELVIRSLGREVGS